jgi:hypothetical protein
VRHAIVDWRPFDYYSFEAEGMIPGTKNLFTIYLQPAEKVTKVLGTVSASSGPEESAAKNDEMMSDFGPEQVRAGCRMLRDKILRDLELGVIVQAEPASPSPTQIEAAAASSLAGSSG